MSDCGDAGRSKGKALVLGRAHQRLKDVRDVPTLG